MRAVARPVDFILLCGMYELLARLLEDAPRETREWPLAEEEAMELLEDSGRGCGATYPPINLFCAMVALRLIPAVKFFAGPSVPSFTCLRILSIWDCVTEARIFVRGFSDAILFWNASNCIALFLSVMFTDFRGTP